MPPSARVNAPPVAQEVMAHKARNLESKAHDTVLGLCSFIQGLVHRIQRARDGRSLLEETGGCEGFPGAQGLLGLLPASFQAALISGPGKLHVLAGVFFFVGMVAILGGKNLRK